jgi:predicted site-specific integrase-resolvase
MQTETKAPKLMSPANVRALFNISKPTEIRWRNNGDLPAPLVMGRRLYYKAHEIERLTS